MFGGLAPLPLRLGGSAEEGWAASQYLRMCADLVASKRTLPFAILTVTRAGAGPTLVKWNSQAPEFAANQPTVTGDNPNPVVVTFPVTTVDEQGVAHALSIRGTKVTRRNGAASPVTITAPNVVSVAALDSNDLDFTLSVYADWRPSEVGDYGATADKEDCETERVPYAWIWYQELEASLGSAFGHGMTGAVHARKAALARALMAVSRHEEQMRNGSTPGTAHPAILESWARSLQVPQPDDDPEYLTRRYCESAFSAKSGQDLVNLELALYELLGPRYVGILIFPDGDPSEVWPTSWNLGGGVWASSRSKILVDVQRPQDTNDRYFKTLMGVHFVRLMDRITPAWVWFDWTSTDGDGFYLDISPLDFTGL